MKSIVVLCLIFLAFSGHSQTFEKNFIDLNYIEVTGQAEMEIVPDLIYLKIVISEKDLKNKQSLDDVEKLMVSKLTELGVDVSKDLSIQDFSSYLKNSWLKEDIILTKNYQLLIHDAKTLKSIYISFQKLGISNVSIDKIDHSKIEQFRREVKIKAIVAAKDKAEALTKSINQTIGKAIYIKENDLNQVMQNRYANAILYKTTSAYSDSYSPEIGFEKITINFGITVRFELK